MLISSKGEIVMNELKKDFPIYQKYPNLVYLDSAASSLKCQAVIDKLDHYYNRIGVNVHRGVYRLSYEATDLYEGARETIAKFINSEFEEVVFTRGCSSSLNLVALSYGMEFVCEGDEVIVSELEHHSNLIPWMNVCKKKGAILKYIPLTKDGRITVEAFKSVITDKTKVVAINHVSNVMGYIAPIKEIVEIAHSYGAIVSVDGAQAIPHMKVDVKELGCDFYSFSGHKMCGPTGVGVLYGKKSLLDKMEPIEFGGDMADEVFKHYATYKDAPYKFETGTPIIAEAIALADACLYLDKVGYDYIASHEHSLKEMALELLKDVNGIEIYNPTCETGIITFNVVGVHPHDAASVFDKNDVCIRAGHHCAQPITHFLGQMATLRASFYFYNDQEDVIRFVETVKETVEFFGQF